MATSALPAAPAAAASAAVSALEASSSEAPGSPSASSSAADASAGEVRTVLHDAHNFNVKHPLYNTWTLWFDNPSAKGTSAAKGGKDSWGEEMNKVVSFDSVEEFWGLYNNIIPPSELPQKANYYLFKEGIQPAWEDAANTNGGKWSIQLPREKSRADIDRLWLNTMLSAIGETLESPYDSSSPAASNSAEAITGIIMSARPNLYRIAIWTRTADESASGELDAALLNIGKHFKVGILGYQLNQQVGGGGMQSDVEFQSHKDSERKGKGRKFVV